MLYQKYFQNGEYVRAAESGTEANYSMIDGVVNNLEPNDKETSQEQEKPQQRDPNAPRESVIKKLRTKQLQIAKDSGYRSICWRLSGS